MSVVEYLEKEDKKYLIEELKDSLKHALVYLPEANADIMVHTLSLLSEDERERYVALLNREEIINNKTLLLNIFGAFVSHKMIADAVHASAVAESILKNQIESFLDNHISDFEQDLAKLTAFSLEELETFYQKIEASANNFSTAMEKADTYMSTQLTILETSYKNRAEGLTKRHEDYMKRMDSEINVKLKNAEILATKTATDAILKAVIPAVTKAIGLKGLLAISGSFGAVMILHDLLKFVFFH